MNSLRVLKYLKKKKKLSFKSGVKELSKNIKILVSYSKVYEINL
jgi:hypothetical protein